MVRALCGKAVNRLNDLRNVPFSKSNLEMHMVHANTERELRMRKRVHLNSPQYDRIFYRRRISGSTKQIGW